MPVDQAADPWRLAGDVAVMSAIAHAGFDQLRAIEAERPGRRRHDASLSRHPVKRTIVPGLGHQDADSGRIDRMEFGAIPSRDSPPQSRGRKLPAVLHRLSARESGGPIEDKVVFAVPRHCHSITKYLTVG